MHVRCGYQELGKLVVKKYALLWLGFSNVALHSCGGRQGVESGKSRYTDYIAPCLYNTAVGIHEQQTVFSLRLTPPPPLPPPFFPPISISYQNWCLKGTGVYGMAIWSGPMLSTALIQLQALGTRAKRGFRLSHLLPNTLQVTTRVSTSATHVLKWL